VTFTWAAARRRRRGAGAEDVDDVVAVGAVDDDDVGRGVAGGAAERAGEVDVDRVRSVPLQVVDGDVSVPPSVLRSIASTSLRSMTMLPRLRVNSTRPPLAEASKISEPALPLNSSVSVPPGPRRRRSRRRGPTGTRRCRRPAARRRCPAGRRRSRCRRRRADVGAVGAEDRVVARAAVDGDLDQGGEVAGGAEESLPPLALRTRFSLVPMSIANGGGVEAVEADAGAVGGGR
jgi:hypothetical protein